MCSLHARASRIAQAVLLGSTNSSKHDSQTSGARMIFAFELLNMFMFISMLFGPECPEASPRCEGPIPELECVDLFEESPPRKLDFPFPVSFIEREEVMTECALCTPFG